MELSVRDSPPPQEHVESYLRQAMPHCEFTYESLVTGYPPMILMRMTHNIAAFAFASGDADKSYDELYNSFREYYLGNRSTLDVYDLSFIFCVHPNVPNLDHFRSRVETDVYFCRKFVVPVAEPLDRSFERLPFLPLAHARGERNDLPPRRRTYGSVTFQRFYQDT